MKTIDASALHDKIRSAVGGGDILFIVPPFVTTKTPILGPHILQAIAEGVGFKTDILHANLLLASMLGVERYEQVNYGQPFRMLGERLFARSAHGLPPLGQKTELCTNSAASVFGSNEKTAIHEFEYKYLNSADFELEAYVKIEELCTRFIEETVLAIAGCEYKLVGCSTNWEQNNCCVALLNGIKRLRPEMLTLIGGANCEGEMAEGIASLSESIDYIFSGESEAIFLDFLKAYMNGKRPSQRILRGVPLDDLNAIPLPDYQSYIFQRNHFLGEEFAESWQIGYETSRGCWWGKCAFCGLNGVGRGRFRQKNVEKSFEDLKEMQRLHPGKLVIMADKVMPESYHKELLPKLEKEKNSPPIAYEQRPNRSFRKLFQLKKANITTIKPGIESLSSGLLKLMNKGITVQENLLLLRNARVLGLYVDWNLLWGFPGDKTEHYEETLRRLPLIRHFCPPAVFRHICIDRFSPYFEKPQEFGIKNIRPWEVYKKIYPVHAELKKLAYRFIGDYCCASVDNPALIAAIAEELTRWKKLWKTSTLTLLPFENFYMIYDKREPGQNPKTHILEHHQAPQIMTLRKYVESDEQRWAVEEKLGIVVDSNYVPLVTAAPELLLTFEEEN